MIFDTSENVGREKVNFKKLDERLGRIEGAIEGTVESLEKLIDWEKHVELTRQYEDSIEKSEPFNYEPKPDRAKWVAEQVGKNAEWFEQNRMYEEWIEGLDERLLYEPEFSQEFVDADDIAEPAFDEDELGY